MRNQRQVKRAINSLFDMGISYSKLASDWNLPIRTITRLAHESLSEYRPEPASLQRANDGLNRYIEKFEREIRK